MRTRGCPQPTTAPRGTQPSYGRTGEAGIPWSYGVRGPAARRTTVPDTGSHPRTDPGCGPAGGRAVTWRGVGVPGAGVRACARRGRHLP
ncbi:hypothetical protein [Streptomyces sp. NPDC050538]|uniref:hypothetical protein n=1 Tax=Streptomyces sp. NPDC050538 TaxID=3365627 RepID=UPI0037A2B9E5